MITTDMRKNRIIFKWERAPYLKVGDVIRWDNLIERDINNKIYRMYFVEIKSIRIVGYPLSTGAVLSNYHITFEDPTGVTDIDMGIKLPENQLAEVLLLDTTGIGE